MIDFWFSIGSTYTYLSVMRLAEVAAETGIEFRWLPFNVRAIMIEMDNIPFAKKPAKAAYMWRDIERRAAMYRMVPKLPAPYPLAELERANRVALIAAREGWCEAYARET
ncbi:MAG: 2-hydroxychromene-2-carboxylate isomerase, partial [Mesorhizobium sp.]